MYNIHIDPLYTTIQYVLHNVPTYILYMYSSEYQEKKSLSFFIMTNKFKNDKIITIINIDYIYIYVYIYIKITFNKCYFMNFKYE